MILEYQNTAIMDGGNFLDPLPNLPANTLRFRFYNTSFDPSALDTTSTFYPNGRGTWTQVSGASHNDWDWTFSDNNWAYGPFCKYSNWTTTDVAKRLGYRYLTGLYDVIAAGDNSAVTNATALFGVYSGDEDSVVTIDGVMKYASEWMDGNGPVHVCNLNLTGCTLHSAFDCCHDLEDVACLHPINIGDYTFYRCTSLTSVPRFVGTYIDTSESSHQMFGAFAGCTALTDISNIGTIDWRWTNQTAPNRGLDFYCGGLSWDNNNNPVAAKPATFGEIPNPLFSITGNEFASTNTPIKNLGSFSESTSLYRTMFFGSGLPNGWINILKWPLHASSNLGGIGSNRGLTSIPTIPSGITATGFGIDGFFKDNPDIDTGMLAAYNALSAITPNGGNCFAGTGTNTVQGNADRAQIPQSWGGDYVVQDLYVGTSWSKSTSTSKGTTWSFTSNVDFSTLTSMQVYTESSISQYAGVNMKKSNIKTKVGSFSNGSVATYYWPAFVQFYGNAQTDGITWGLFPTNYNGTLTSSQSSGDMPGTLSYSNYGNHSMQLGTYSSSRNVVFCIIVTNTSTLSASSLSNYGVLWNSYFYNDPVLRAVTSTVTPQSAIINS